jgi:hypothetical protein
VPFVESLGDLERARGGEAEAAVRRALQRGEIEEHRRGFAHRASARALDARTGWLCGECVLAIARDDGVGELLCGEARCEAAIREGAPVRDEAFALGGGELGADFPVRPRHEGADLALAADDHRERGRLHAADRVERVVARIAAARGDGARGVHADEPVRLGARAGGVGERIELGAGAERREAAADRFICQRRDPQALHR